MTDYIYVAYKQLTKMIKNADKCCNEHTCEQNEQLTKWKETIQLIQEIYPDLKYRYEQETQLRKSFSKEQINFICDQIGHWYVDWKDNLVDYDSKQHRLGYVKEQLKTMITGE